MSKTARVVITDSISKEDQRRVVEPMQDDSLQDDLKKILGKNSVC